MARSINLVGNDHLRKILYIRIRTIKWKLYDGSVMNSSSISHSGLIQLELKSAVDFTISIAIR